VWVTNSGGGLGNHRKVETISAGGTRRFHARAVRSVYSSTVLPSRFTNNSLLTALDNVTGLMWQKSIMKDTLSWEDALRYADSAMTGGYSDWRLPNIKEMQSINDAKLIGPSINSNYFNNSGVKKYWSSTTLPNQTAKAWYLNTQFGVTTYDNKTVKHNLICVRSNQSSTAISTAKSIWPPRKAVRTAGVPLKGTTCTSMPAVALKSSAARC
jgi:hypothetical protein